MFYLKKISHSYSTIYKLFYESVFKKTWFTYFFPSSST